MVDRRDRPLRYRQGRSGRPYERAKQRVYDTETHCARCLREVDKSRPYIDPLTGKPDPLSKSAGHRQELDLPGSDPYDLQLEHLGCNSSAGAVYGNAKRRAATAPASEPGPRRRSKLPRAGGGAP